MSAYALIIGLTHVSGEPVVISGPEVPFAEQRKRFKEAMNERVNDTFQRIDFVDSRRGVRKRKTFISPTEAKAREKAVAAEEKELAKTSKPAREKKPETTPTAPEKKEDDPPQGDPPTE